MKREQWIVDDHVWVLDVKTIKSNELNRKTIGKYAAMTILLGTSIGYVIGLIIASVHGNQLFLPSISSVLLFATAVAIASWIVI